MTNTPKPVELEAEWPIPVPHPLKWVQLTTASGQHAPMYRTVYRSEADWPVREVVFHERDHYWHAVGLEGALPGLEAAQAAVFQKIQTDLRQGLIARPIEELLATLEIDICESLGTATQFREMCEMLRGRPVFRLPEIPFSMKRSGAMVSRGLHATYVIEKRERGLVANHVGQFPWESAPVATLKDAENKAQAHFQIRMDHMHAGVFEHRLKANLLHASQLGGGALLEAAQAYACGRGHIDGPQAPLAPPQPLVRDKEDPHAGALTM